MDLYVLNGMNLYVLTLCTERYGPVWPEPHMYGLNPYVWPTLCTAYPVYGLNPYVWPEPLCMA